MTRDERYTAPRVGRPRREEAGDVDARILSAATELFLEKGVAATSCDAVAARARVGKASLYSRYSGKDALFEAVVKHAVESTTFKLDIAEHLAGTMKLRLALVGRAVLSQALSPIPLELMRLFLTEARRSPDLIRHVDDTARAKIVEMVARSIVQDDADSDSQAKARELAERFLDLTFAPIILAALSGRDTQTSADAVTGQIEFALAMLERLGLFDETASVP
jgi:AcrR family transcriptional regulator